MRATTSTEPAVVQSGVSGRMLPTKGPHEWKESATSVGRSASRFSSQTSCSMHISQLVRATTFVPLYVQSHEKEQEGF